TWQSLNVINKKFKDAESDPPISPTTAPCAERNTGKIEVSTTEITRFNYRFIFYKKTIKDLIC
ncbi:MAG: hypothetical protein VW873_02005, partial [Betaproteobacteria bacterium]